MREAKPLHDHAFRLALRLLNGEVLDFADRHGRRWRATSTALLWVRATDEAPVIEGCAADIAIEIVQRRLLVRNRGA